MASSDIRAGRAYVEIGANDKLDKDLRKAEKKLKDFAESVRNIGFKLGAAGLAIAAPLTAAVKTFMGMGDELAKASQRTGVSVEALSELKYAAEQSGAGLEELEAGLRKMQKSLVDAARGSKTSVDALAVLGLAVRDLASLSPDQQFELIADRLSKISDPTLKAATAMELFGKSGTQLLPMIEDGAAGIQALRQRCRELGLTMSTEDANAAVKFGDTLDDLWKVIKQGTFDSGAVLARWLQGFAEKAVNIAAKFNRWSKTNGDLVLSLAKVGAALLVGAGAVLAFSMVISVAQYAISGLLATASLLVLPFKAIIGAISLLPVILGSLFSPIGLVLIGLGAIATYFLYTKDAGTQAMDIIRRSLGRLWESLKWVLQNSSTLGEAWTAGLSEAGHLIAEGWERAKGLLKNSWLDLKDWLSNLWQAIADVMEEKTIAAIARAMEGMVRMWNVYQKITTDLGDYIARRQIQRELDSREKNAKEDGELEKSGKMEPWQKDRAERNKKAIADLKLQLEQLDNVHQANLKILSDDAKDQIADIHTYAQASIDQLHNDLNKRQAPEDSSKEKTKNDQDVAAAITRIQAQRDADRFAHEYARSFNFFGGGKSLYESAMDLFGGSTAGEAPPEKPKVNSGEILDSINSIAGKVVAPRGTFQASMVQSLQTDDSSDKIVKATEATARNTKDLLRKAQSGGLVFAY